MRDNFPGYFRPRQAEFDELWNQGLIVPDTNIFLHLLRYRRETRDEIIKTLKAFEKQLWIPYQVAFEFARRWASVEAANRVSYEKLKTDLQTQGRVLSSLYDGLARYQVVDASGEKAKIEKFVGSLCSSIGEAFKNYPTPEEVESVVDQLSQLVAGAIGKPPTIEIKKEWIAEATERYANKTPPGYKDENKDGSEKYGDFLIWREMQEAAKENSKPVIFLSDDRKEDWVLIRDGQDKGPRPELMQEFWEKTGQRFYNYPLRAFLGYAEKYTKVAVSDNAIKEIEEQARRRKSELQRREREKRNLELTWMETIRTRPSIGVLHDDPQRVSEVSTNALMKYFKSRKTSDISKTLDLMKYRLAVAKIEAEKNLSDTSEPDARHKAAKRIEMMIATDKAIADLERIAALERLLQQTDQERTDTYPNEIDKKNHEIAPHNDLDDPE